MWWIALFAFILCNFDVYKWEKANIKDLMLEDFLMNFLCIYLGEGKVGGGGYTIACISA